MGRELYCFWLCLLVGIASTVGLGIPRHPTRQADALNKLFFEAATLQRRAGSRAPWDGTKTLSSNLLSSMTYSQEGLKEKDRISMLPGQPKGVDFNQYGGYVTVDAQHGRALFYYFVEAAGFNHSSKPLLLWLNGGPGCSSLGYGAMEELGPFRVASDGKTLYRNPYAWNGVANVLFLESPAGVGFSYSNTTSDYDKSGDRRTADDAYVFLVNWLERFPEYKGRDFYIAGESYAGHYVPQLAHTIVQHNNSIIGLKGIIIGNAVINDETDNRGMYDYFWTHALISDETIDVIHKYCNFSTDATTQTDQCQKALGDASEVFNTLDIYNIYNPLCFSSAVTPTPKRPSIRNFDPCSDIYVDAYLNNPEVQEAFHANVTKLKYPWTSCSGVIMNWEDSPTTVLPLIQELIAAAVRVWVYSGDIDGRVPVTSTRYSLNQLQLSINNQWQPWNANNEVGGYSVGYDGNLSFVTIRGAGHEVPSFQAFRSSLLIKYFLEGKSLPT